MNGRLTDGTTAGDLTLLQSQTETQAQDLCHFSHGHTLLGHEVSSTCQWSRLRPVDELVKQAFAALRAGTLEIRPGKSNQLALMRRLAPGFINRQLWKATKKLVPV